jgi:hypothetical protein
MIFFKKISHKTKVNLFAMGLLALVFLIASVVCATNLFIIQMTV